ncbi:MAG: exodeoxyribonuclease VII small subunit [Syntrophales bacterium]
MAKDKFEEALKKLEELVKKMESGDLALEDSLKAFEEGIRLIRFCTGKLDEAERRVEILIKDDQGDITPASFLRNEGDAL